MLAASPLPMTTPPIDLEATSEHAQLVAKAREAQLAWQGRTLRDRLIIIRQLRHLIESHADALCDAITAAHRQGRAESLSAEILPLADACRFLELKARRLFRARRVRRRGRPMWLTGVTLKEYRDPFGVVFIVGPSNYPLLLAGVQAVQALVVGNAVIVKPGRDGRAVMGLLRELFVSAGGPGDAFQVTDEEVEHVPATIKAGVDKIVLTGGQRAGVEVMHLAAEKLIPVTAELSGCDAVFVLESAELEVVAKAIVFGLVFNSSQTCIAPRRVFVTRPRLVELEALIAEELARWPVPAIALNRSHQRLVQQAIDGGGRVVVPDSGELEGARLAVVSEPPLGSELLRTDVFSPIVSLIPVTTMMQALQIDGQCPYALGASIFGSRHDATRLAEHVNAGCIVINDMLAPTADPRVSFGGRKRSGFGVTRGGAGLLEMTQLKVVVVQRKRWRPQLDVPTPLDGELLRALLKMLHGQGLFTRLAGLRSLVSAAMKQRKAQQQAAQNHVTGTKLESGTNQPRKKENHG